MPSSCIRPAAALFTLILVMAPLASAAYADEEDLPCPTVAQCEAMTADMALAQARAASGEAFRAAEGAAPAGTLDPTEMLAGKAMGDLDAANDAALWTMGRTARFVLLDTMLPLADDTFCTLQDQISGGCADDGLRGRLPPLTAAIHRSDLPCPSIWDCQMLVAGAVLDAARDGSGAAADVATAAAGSLPAGAEALVLLIDGAHAASAMTFDATEAAQRDAVWNGLRSGADALELAICVTHRLYDSSCTPAIP